MFRSALERLEREASRLHRELVVVIDQSEAGEYIALGTVGREFEQLDRAELEALKAERGEALLVVSVEKPRVNPGVVSREKSEVVR